MFIYSPFSQPLIYMHFSLIRSNNNNIRTFLKTEGLAHSPKKIPPPCGNVEVRADKSGDRAIAEQWHRDTSGDTFWLSGIYFLVHAIFVASKLWIWQHFKETQSKPANFWISKTFVHGFLLLSNWKHLKFHSFWLCCQIMSRITPFFGPILCRESRCFRDTFQP